MSWNIDSNIQTKNVHFYNQSIIFWIKILIFGFENIIRIQISIFKSNKPFLI